MHLFSKPLSLIISRVRPRSYQVATLRSSSQKMLQTKSTRGSGGWEEKFRQYQRDTHEQQSGSKEDLSDLDEVLYLRYLENEATLFHRCQDQLIERHKLGVQQADKLASSAFFASVDIAARNKIEERINIREALKHTVREALRLKKLEKFKGMQRGLSDIARMDEFTHLLKDEADTRRLVPKQITLCAHNLYHEVSKHLHGNEGTVTIPSAGFPVNERAALVVFMRLQSEWKYPLKWVEGGGENPGGK